MSNAERTWHEAWKLYFVVRSWVIYELFYESLTLQLSTYLNFWTIYIITALKNSKNVCWNNFFKNSMSNGDKKNWSNFFVNFSKMSLKFFDCIKTKMWKNYGKITDVMLHLVLLNDFACIFLSFHENKLNFPKCQDVLKSSKTEQS